MFIFMFFRLYIWFVFKLPISFLRNMLIKPFCKIPFDSYIGRNCEVKFPFHVKIGHGTVINKNSLLDGRGGYIYIGDNVDIAQNIRIWTCEHDINDKNHGPKIGDVYIDDYVWIASNVTILPGVHIGKGAVVATGAVVTKNVGDFEVVGGIPAKKIGERKNECLYKLSKPFFLG